MDTGHIGPEFRAAFGSWQQVAAHVSARVDPPAFDTDRALHQLVMADIVSRLNALAGFNWVLRGSLTLAVRAGSNDLPQQWRRGTRLDPRHVYARPVFDVDLCAADLPDQVVDGPHASALLARAAARVTDVRRHPGPGSGIGLAGLVHYHMRGLRPLRDGRVVGEVTAQPIDPTRSRRHLVPAGDALTVALDLAPPAAAVFSGEPESPLRSILAVTVPGFAPDPPRLYPTVHQIADKLWLLAGPHSNPPWHRYKDLFDLYYLTATCEIPLRPLRRALENNPNRRRLGLGELPRPYRPYDDPQGPGWRAKYEQMRGGHPALSSYPSYDRALLAVQEFVHGMPTAADALWLPRHGWRPRVPPARPPLRPSAAQERVDRQPGPHVTPPAGYDRRRPGPPPR